MTIDEALAYLASLAPSTVRMGLERIAAALERLGDPQRAYRTVHVAGTNGKGSTCALIASCLAQSKRVGFYSSPHLVRVNERFKVNGEDISDEVLAARVTELLERLGRDHELTYFEFGTALAFWHFAREHVDVAVIEVGLGGRLDATVLCAPSVTAITSISFDHQEFLGDTLPAIAAEKAGIVKPGVPLVVARQPAEVLEVFERVAREQGAALIVEGRDVGFRGDTFTGHARALGGLSLPLLGAHQSQNAGVALACLEVLAAQGVFEWRDDDVRKGVAETRWPGRLQEIDGVPPIVLDGAHNPAGVDALVAALGRLYAGRPLHLVFGVFADKDSAPMMRALFPLMESVHLAPLHSPRSKDPASYVTFAKTLAGRVEVAPSVEAALDEALAQSGVVVVAGSLHLVGEALAALERRFDELLEALRRFTPGDDPDETMRLLGDAVLRGRPALDPVRYRRAVFALLEAFPDAEFGTPGVVIHEVERRPGYEAELEASLARQPTFLTVSMVNRLMNLTHEPEALTRWSTVLEAASRNDRAPDWVRKAARRYLEHQRDR